MPDFPVPYWPPLNVITPWHSEAMGQGLKGGGTVSGLLSTSSTTPSAANDVHYHPFKMFETRTAVKMSYIVGGTANGNVDLGIYDSQKNRLVNSGSTAQGTINTLQELDITDTTLTPGVYFMAITFSSATGTGFAQTFLDEIIQSTVPNLIEALGVFGLPATAAWVSSTNANPRIHAMGVHFDTLL